MTNARTAEPRPRRGVVSVIRHSSLVVPLLLSACGPRITNANIEAVNKEFERRESNAPTDPTERGMSPKEVESILGIPSQVENFKIEVQTRKPVLDGVRYYYEQDGQTVVLHFVENKLISKAPLLGETTPPDPQPRKE